MNGIAGASQPDGGSDDVGAYLASLAAVSVQELSAAASQALEGADRDRYVALAHRRGMSRLGQAAALDQQERRDLRRLERLESQHLRGGDLG